MRKRRTTTEVFEAALQAAENSQEKYLLRLYVAGLTARSTRAIENIRRVCAQYLEGRYELEVIDLHQDPHLAKEDKILAAPTLVKSLPPPLRRIIGDLSDEDRVLVGLDLQPKS
jgi:circadian clock protein KaiB